MTWMMIVLEILKALPGTIDLIQRIVTAINGHPLQIIHENAFKQIVSDWKVHKDHERLVHDLNGLHVSIK